MKNPIERLEDLEGQVAPAKRYRKKPIVIRAVELTEKVRIVTREGELTAEPGDFLIEGVQGEVYPCGREIFFATYEDA